MNGKVNSESRLLGNFIENLKLTIKNIVLAEVKSPSMDPLIKQGSRVPIIVMPKGTQYVEGDIIAFERDDVIIIHRIEYVYESNGKTFYVTEGINPETNQYVDDSLVSEEDIVGITDLSENAFDRVQELAKLGKLSIIEAYAMPEKSDLRNPLQDKMEINENKDIFEVKRLDFNNYKNYEKLEDLIKSTLKEKIPGISEEYMNEIIEEFENYDIEKDYFKVGKERIENPRKNPKNLNTKVLLKSTLYETLGAYYEHKEVEFRRFLTEYRQAQENGDLMKLRQLRKDNLIKDARTGKYTYHKAWVENDGCQHLQRLFFGILCEFRNPWTGQQIDIMEWLQTPLHHWLTAEGHENKGDCEFSSVIPVPKRRPSGLTRDNFLTHNDISIDVNYDPNPPQAGKEWQDKINRAIVRILKSQAPNQWGATDRRAFERYLNKDVTKTARKMVMWLFVNNLNFNIFEILGIESLIT
ncbi:MAG: hypothetical protein ACFFA3_20640 [Promethearchaeota archaeon]